MVSTRSNRLQPAQNSSQRGRVAQRGRGISRRGRGGGSIRSRLTVQNGDASDDNSRLAVQNGNSTPSDEPGGQSDSISSPVDLGTTRLTMENYESLLESWSNKQLREVLARQQETKSQIPPAIKEALQFHKMNYTKLKLMLALLGNCSAKMVNSWL